MKALVFDKSKYDWENSKGFELVDIPEPVLDEKNNEADADYVIMKVHYAGVCGTDRGIWNRMAFKDAILNSIDEQNQPLPASPLEKGRSTAVTPSFFKEGAGGVRPYRIIGHEFFGEIVKIGSNVKNVKVGDFVSCESHVVCQKCYNCLRGQKEVCTNEKILGISHDGGFAEFAKVPAHILWKTDTSKIRPEIAAMQEPFGNAVHAGSKVDLKDKTVAIFGLGPIGMFLILVAKGLGAKLIIGVEPNPIAAEMAKKLGIDYVIALNTTPPPQSGATPPLQEGNTAAPRLSKDLRSSPPIIGGVPPLQRGGGGKSYAHDSTVTDEIKKITNGVGVDVSFEMAGFNSSVNNTLYATRRGGEIILFGIKAGDFTLEDYNRIIVHGFTFHCVIGRQLWKTWESTRALLENTGNGVQEKLFNIILDRGNGTILPISEYTKEKFEDMMSKHPKFLIQF